MGHHIVPEYTAGQKCWCGYSASHKVEEVIEDDTVHPYTAYLCCNHFCGVMGKVALAACRRAEDSRCHFCGQIHQMAITPHVHEPGGWCPYRMYPDR